MSDNFTPYHEAAKHNKEAFNDVFGDPFAINADRKREPLEGNLARLRARSNIRVANNEFDLGQTTRNTAAPSMTDFFCDVDRVVNKCFADDPSTLTKFTETYILEITETAFTPRERGRIEQKVGRMLRSHGICPVTKYFKPVREGHFSKRPDRNNQAV